MSTVDHSTPALEHRPDEEGPPEPWSHVVCRWQTPMLGDASAPEAPPATDPACVDRPPLWRRRWEAAAEAETGIFPGELT
jgi:hypothetical protein